MSPRKFTPELFACALIALAAFAARAEEPVVYGPDGAPTVVQRKLYTMTGKAEVGLAGATALNTSLVDHYGGLLTLAYHPNEWFDVGVDLMGNLTGVSQLGRNIRADLLSSRAHAPLKDEFANDNQMRGGAFLTARLAPIYGKLNLAGEMRLHFQAFLLAGAGAAKVHRESINLCADAGTSPIASCGQFEQTDFSPFTGEAGGGFRVYLNQSWSLRTEVRGFFFRSSYKQDNDLIDPATTGTPRNYLAVIAMFFLGVSRTF